MLTVTADRYHVGVLRMTIRSLMAIAAFALSGAAAQAHAALPPPADAPLAHYRPLLSGAGGRNSPTGDRIAYWRHGPSGEDEVWTADADGGAAVCLTCGNSSIASRRKGNASWHPSGEWLVFQVAKPAPHPHDLSDPGLGKHNDIWMISASGGRAYKVHDLPCDEPPGHHYALLQPAFNADGTMLYWSESYISTTVTHLWGVWGIRVAEFAVVDGIPTLSNLRWLPDVGHPGYREFDEFLDSDTLLISANPRPFQPLTALDVYRYDLATGGASMLTSSPDFDEQAHASTYGIAFVSSMPYGAPRGPFDYSAASEVWLMEEDGTDLRQLTAFNSPRYLTDLSSALGVARAMRATAAQVDWHPDGGPQFLVSVFFRLRGGGQLEYVYQGMLK